MKGGLFPEKLKITRDKSDYDKVPDFKTPIGSVFPFNKEILINSYNSYDMPIVEHC